MKHPKHKALKEKQKEEKHEHRYKKGVCVHCGKEENVEWGENEKETGGRETGKEDGK